MTCLLKPLLLNPEVGSALMMNRSHLCSAPPHIKLSIKWCTQHKHYRKHRTSSSKWKSILNPHCSCVLSCCAKPPAYSLSLILEHGKVVVCVHMFVATLVMWSSVVSPPAFLSWSFSKKFNTLHIFLGIMHFKPCLCLLWWLYLEYCLTFQPWGLTVGPEKRV